MSQLRRRPKDAPPRRDRSREFASFELPRAESRMATALDKPRPAPVPALLQKVPDRKRQSLRDSANGEECTVRIVGACNGRTDTTVLAHLPELVADRGMAIKGIDEAAAFACVCCHDVVDGRRPLPAGASRTSVMLDFFRGHVRTLVRWKQKGLL